ncbi:glycine cleavage system protein GcvH [Pseudodesulfovibrio cashew]|uniref:Glycine cleavage system H protein n=1 Tax=Pseudodesulfovibrio cashew TaxID=2678688 RepID=A0A6I6JPA1_9BACT|nr:glycine cleavage system protein GcvH [Pseudodesulfovibrio cashew]QGY41873.1 glycine cleavage system protein GcvH [Pseudodesulfovibrio cashew]
MSELTFPNDVLYHPEHTWVRIAEDGSAVVGISDFAQEQLGEVAFVDLPETGASFAAGEEFGTVESIKAVSSLYMPINGTVTEVNSSLEDDPSQVNTSPYGDGWMLRITVEAEADKSQLLSNADYEAQIK